jgi:hypothetical protein
MNTKEISIYARTLINYAMTNHTNQSSHGKAMLALGGLYTGFKLIHLLITCFMNI